MAAKRWKLTQFGIQKALERLVAGNQGELSMLETTALDGMGEAVVLDPAGPDPVAMLRLAARGGGGMWRLADTHGAAMTVTLDRDTTVRLEGEIDESHLTGYRWLRSFWVATLMREAETRDRLLTISLALEGPRRHTQAFELHWIAAIRAHARGLDPSDSIAAALAAVRPAHSQLDEDWLRMIERPRIEFAGRVFARDTAGAETALREAFEQHRLYWERQSNADDGDGWFSLSLAAMMILARDKRLALATTSDYAPEQLLARL